MRQIVQSALLDLVPRSPVFTTAQLAQLTGISPARVSRDLGEAARSALILRICPGVWAYATHPDFSPYLAVPYLVGGDANSRAGYVSLVTALSLRGLIQQVPGTIQVVVRTQRRAVNSPVGRFEFHVLEPALFGGFEEYGSRTSFPLATAEKALFDTLLLSVKRGRRFRYLPEVSWPIGFKTREVERWIRKIRDLRARSAVTSRWLELRQQAEARTD